MNGVRLRDRVLLSRGDGLLLMVLSPLAIDSSTLNLSETQRELSRLIAERSDGLSNLWGYYPDLDPDPAVYPESLRLADGLAEQAMCALPLAIRDAMRLAFVRLAVGEPQSLVGGMHIDVHAGINHEWPPCVPPDWHVLRMLLNLGDFPRRLEFCPLTVGELRQRHEIVVSRSRHEPIELPEQIPSCHVDIPARTDDTIWCLMFVSSMIPHVGRTDRRGHFLVSFGGYVPPNLLPMIWR